MGFTWSTSSSTSTSVFTSASTSTSRNGQQPEEHHSAQQYSKSTQTSPDGTTTVRTIRHVLGQPIIVEEHRYDKDGRELAALPDARSDGMRRIEEVGDEEFE
ncbi:uncharacterized protein DSM5745_07595 [Aspergillus mulundensis]|uniref:Uncharacterized protein n=1 Tax=Aspergillus mulundensis TaxID=1810919 RepID=A0A3D8RED4_9EURO|nr:Uncharacterized protein DSM5745_07595 [Aspergillus mulundensis]RDW72423.1 Uncharacterized protein DSM5745_07595 [Aspergillus mulundensis]